MLPRMNIASAADAESNVSMSSGLWTINMAGVNKAFFPALQIPAQFEIVKFATGEG